MAFAGELVLEVCGHGGGGNHQAGGAGGHGTAEFLEDLGGFAGARRAEENSHGDSVQRRPERIHLAASFCMSCWLWELSVLSWRRSSSAARTVVWMRERSPMAAAGLSRWVSSRTARARS